MAKLFDAIKRVQGRVLDWMNKPNAGSVPEGVVLKEGDPAVGDWVKALYSDAVAYRNHTFSGSKYSRFNYTDPIRFNRDLLTLEAGNHWQVWGRRNLDEFNQWKQELVDDEMTDQIRVRVAYLTANWHDVQVSPNIANINEILDQERKATDWSREVRTWVKFMCTFGEVHIKSVFDRSIDPRGLAREITCEPGSILRSPYSTSKQKSESCWYVQHVTMVTGQWIEENYPTFDRTKLSPVSGEFARQVSTSAEYSFPEYDHTKVYPHIETWMDDNRLEDAPFDPEQFQLELSLLLEGQPQPVDPDANHQKYVEAYGTYLDGQRMLGEQTMLEGGMQPGDEELLQNITELVEMQIEDHIRTAMRRQSEQGIPPGKRRKYPNGRLICTICDEVALDIPNPYDFDWRHLFHTIKNEDVPLRLDGRGDIEILWNINKQLDMNLSRGEDANLLAAIPKPWFSEEDRATIEKDGFDNDPTKPGFYTRQAPVFPRAPGAAEFQQAYQTAKQNAQKKLGVTDISFGNPPTAQSSGKLADILLQQNQALVTGEANSSLNDIIEDILETRMRIMRQFYTEPRLYTVNGVQKAINVSRALSVVMVEENGQQVEKEISGFEVEVRPESNFPQRWERTLALFVQLAAVTYPDGTPVIPPTMIQDLLAERFPQMAKGGEYRTESQALQMGLQAMQQQQQAQEMQVKELEAQNKRGRAELMKGGNGGGKVFNRPRQVPTEAAPVRPMEEVSTVRHPGG